MVPLALPGLTAPAVAGRGLSEGLGRTFQRCAVTTALADRWKMRQRQHFASDWPVGDLHVLAVLQVADLASSHLPPDM